MTRIAYIVSRFPKVSETFILDEILELERMGGSVEIFSLLRGREPAIHPEAYSLVSRTHRVGLLSPALLGAQLYWLLRAPRALVLAWVSALIGNLPSPKFLIRAVFVVAHASLFALRMRRLGVEHVHAHWATHPALAAYLVHRLTGLPYSFTAHADDIFVEQVMLKEKIQRARFVVTISEYNRRFLSSLCGAENARKLEVVRCGVRTDAFRPTPERDGGAPFQLACVARLEAKKGHRHLLEACALLAGRGVDFRCVLVGEGSERATIEAKIAALGLMDHVELLGAQPRARVQDVLAAAHVVVQPSIVEGAGRREGIPVALMEAMATGRPVVASALSGVPELVEHERTGLLVEPADAEALAAALGRLRGDPQLARRLGDAGRRRVLESHDLVRNVQRLRSIFAERSTLDTIASPVSGGMPREAGAIPR